MSTFLNIIKKTLFFFMFGFIVTWLTSESIIFFLKTFGDFETLEIIHKNQNTVYGSINFCAIVSFILTYLCAYFIINRKIKKKYIKLILYFLIYGLFFSGITCLL